MGTPKDVGRLNTKVSHPPVQRNPAEMYQQMRINSLDNYDNKIFPDILKSKYSNTLPSVLLDNNTDTAENQRNRGAQTSVRFFPSRIEKMILLIDLECLKVQLS